MRYNHIILNNMYCIMILKDKSKTRRKEVFLYTPVTNENYLKKFKPYILIYI